MFITLGTGIHYIDFQPFPYSKNTLLFISKGQVHSFEIRSDTDGFLILFTEEFLLRNLGQLDQHFIYKLYNYYLYEPLLQLEEEMQIANAFDEIYLEFNSAAAFARDEILQVLLKLLLLRIERIRCTMMPPAKNSEWVRVYIDFKHLLGQKISSIKKCCRLCK